MNALALTSPATQSMLEPASRGAESIAGLWWILLGGATVLFAFVMLLVVLALRSPPRAVETRAWIVGLGLVMPVIVLSALLVHSVQVGNAFAHSESARALRVEVIGRQWWWEVRYESPDGSGQVVLANELRLPGNCMVDLRLRTADVIHSFWVPALAGKVDMIPGRENRLLIDARDEGVYRAQCAEYCGTQHARMALEVLVVGPESFRQWLVREARPAAEPSDSLQRNGRDLFTRAGCGTCHTIRGTQANGTLGPDLTHVGSRRTLAAGTLRNHIGTMAAWIVDAQTLKPGSLMPSMPVYSGAELQAVAAYLSGLE